MARERPTLGEGGKIDLGNFIRTNRLHEMDDDDLEAFLIEAFLGGLLVHGDAGKILCRMGRMPVNEVAENYGSDPT